MTNIHQHLSMKIPIFQFKNIGIILLFLFIVPFKLFSQKKDTIIIKFDEQNEEMIKADFTREMQAGSPEEELKKSIAYYIEQMEPSCGYDSKFSFTHSNQSQKAYKKFGGDPPVILHKKKSFLNDKKVLDVNFFRTTPYLKIAKTFEEEDSWTQDVAVFMMDVDEIKNDSIVLREVTFTRPVKE